MHKDRIEALQALVDALSEPALLIDDQRVIRAANRACARSLGVEPEALVGEPGLVRLPPELLAAHGSGVQTALAGQSVAFEETRNNRHLLHQLEPVIDPAGRVTGVAVFTTDVTSLMRDRASGRQSGPPHSTIADTCLEGVWQIDSEARTTFMNARLVEDSAAAVLSKVEDKRFSILEEFHCRSDCIGAGFMIAKSAKIHVTNVAVHPFDAFKSEVDPPREPAVLFAFGFGGFAALRPRRNRLLRETDAEVFILAYRL